jgi:predicted branched-subunit amino acid permease
MNAHFIVSWMISGDIGGVVARMAGSEQTTMFQVASLSFAMGFIAVLRAAAVIAAAAAMLTFALGALNFADGSEFVAIQLWSDPAALLLIAGMTLLVNCRRIIMRAAPTPFLCHLLIPRAPLVLSRRSSRAGRHDVSVAA